MKNRWYLWTPALLLVALSALLLGFGSNLRGRGFSNAEIQYYGDAIFGLGVALAPVALALIVVLMTLDQSEHQSRDSEWLGLQRAEMRTCLDGLDAVAKRLVGDAPDFSAVAADAARLRHHCDLIEDQSFTRAVANAIRAVESAQDGETGAAAADQVTGLTDEARGLFVSAIAKMHGRKARSVNALEA